MFMERPAGCLWNGWPDAVEFAPWLGDGICGGNPQADRAEADAPPGRLRDHHLQHGKYLFVTNGWRI